MRLILGLDRPTSGTATVNGRPYHELSAPLREVGALLEARAIHTGRSAYHHLLAMAQTHGIGRQRVDEVIELVGLTEVARKRAGGFSLGMGQRLGIASALLGDPEVLILDEPANGLDPEGVRWLRDLIHGLTDDGRTVLVSSHILAEIAHTVDSVVILDHGRLVTHAPLEQLTGAAGWGVRVRTPSAEELREVLSRAGIDARITEPDRVEIVNATCEQIGTLAAKHQIPIFEITPHQVNLEDVFLELTGTKASEQDSR
ncbi:MAG: ATP-binding cassette domain-containing protein, partial [Solirubrobacteraceae bacterium]